MNPRLKYTLIILVPLVLSGYSHLWNLLGFPSIHIDEAHYMRRTLLVLEGWGPQESASNGYPRTYDHPYFGQLLLAGLLGATGYPGSINPTANVNSIELLHLVPRILIGILAVFDTFVIFKIGERRYNTNIALMASILFAIMPFTWVFRRVYLDTLLMPFLLSSVLCAIYLKETRTKIPSAVLRSKFKLNRNVVIILSGIFLGLAIYTKIPAFTLMPLIGALIFFNTGRSLKGIVLWLLPVILIPMMWPLYSVVVGQSDLWIKWVLWQTDRNRPLSISIMNLFQIDPLITIIGIAGTALAVMRKDFLPLLWILPFLLFYSFVGWVQYFHLILIFPAFCISWCNIDRVHSKIYRKVFE